MNAMPDSDGDWAPQKFSLLQETVKQTTVAALGAAKAQKALAKATVSAAKAARNAIAKFDELHLSITAGSDKGSESSGGSGGKGNTGKGNTGKGSGGKGSTGKGSSGKKSTVKEETEQEISALSQLAATALAAFSALEERLRVLFAPTITAWQTAFLQIGAALSSAFVRMQLAAKALWSQSLEPLFNYLVKVFVPGIVNTFSTVFAPIFSAIATAAVEVFAKGFQSACLIVQSAVNTLILPALQFLQRVFTEICASIALAWKTHGAALIENFKGIVEQIITLIQTLYTTIIQPVLAGIGAALQTLWNNHLAPLWKNLTDLVAQIGVAVLALWNHILLPFINFMVSTLGPVITRVVTTLASIIGGVAGVVADVVGSVLNALRGLMEFLTGVFTGNWARAWEGVKGVFGGVWNAIVGLLKGAVNTIIDCVNALVRGVAYGINGVVNALNTIHVTIPKWVPVFGGKSFGVNLQNVKAPQIPRLAKGGVLPPNAEFLAVLGDQKNGRNIETPEKLLRQILREETAQSTGKFETNQPVELALDGNVFYRTMLKIKAERGMSIGGVFADAT
ncbi:MAG: hypothetical protein RR395_02455 [Ruthenibacterium sp.]